MNITILFPLLAFLVSAMTAFQPLTNAKLNEHVDSPLWVSFLSFAIGAVLLLVIGLIYNGKFMTLETQGLKWWMFASGFLGAAYVTTTLIVVPHIGIASLVALTTAGVLIMAAILDHYGVLAENPNPMSLLKFFGLCLVGVGAIIALKA